MVDGSGVGADVQLHHTSIDINKDDIESVSFTEHYQDFRGADLIVIDAFSARKVEGRSVDEKKGSNWTEYPVYAVYGSKIVVSSIVSEMTLSQYYDLWKDRLIMATKKPYILSGDKL